MTILLPMWWIDWLARYLRDSLRSHLRLKVHPGETDNTAVRHLHSSSMKNHAREWVAPTRLCKEQRPQHQSFGDPSGELVRVPKADRAPTPWINIQIGKIYENRGLSTCLDHFECLCHRLRDRFGSRNLTGTQCAPKIQIYCVGIILYVHFLNTHIRSDKLLYVHKDKEKVYCWEIFPLQGICHGN